MATTAMSTDEIADVLEKMPLTPSTVASEESPKASKEATEDDLAETSTVASQDEATEEDQAEKDKIEKACRKRRSGVANESVSQEQIANYVKPVHEKSEEAAAWILDIIKTCDKMQVLFGHLDETALKDVINAFYSLEITKGENVIKQNEEGDGFYIVEDGQFDIFVARQGDDGKLEESTKVMTCGPRTAFGELALMYNSPRAATVTCVVDKARVWALDREAFQMLIMNSQDQKLQMYEGWLQHVPILKTLNHYELSQISELLTSELVEEGEDIVKQGEEGDKFHILEEGEVCAFISEDQGETIVKTYSSPGDYFGEIALISNAPQKATVRATKDSLIHSVYKEDFYNIMGPIKELLAKHIDEYPDRKVV